MNDEMKLCANCHHEHAWGIVGYSLDNVPLYGARRCSYLIKTDSMFDHAAESCACDRFVEAIPGQENLPALSQSQIKGIWAQTSFMNAQVPLATRIAVSKIMELGEGLHGGRLLEKQWPEFVGLVISQLTDIRGAMVRDDSKFAHLVAHTDEVVESMRAVSQLAERLNSMYALNNRMVEQIEKLTEEVRALKSDTAAPPPVAIKDKHVICATCPHPRFFHKKGEGRCRSRSCKCDSFTYPASFAQSARTFSDNSRPLRDEAISTDAADTNSQCNCWCKGDLFKAPEQHAATCPESLMQRMEREYTAASNDSDDSGE